jgi:hypothetical protein
LIFILRDERCLLEVKKKETTQEREFHLNSFIHANYHNKQPPPHGQTPGQLQVSASRLRLGRQVSLPPFI